MPKVERHWPEEVALPTGIGSQYYRDRRSGDPCCAAGHMRSVLNPDGPEESRWRAMYVRGAEHVFKLEKAKSPIWAAARSVERLNDMVSNDTGIRDVLYAVAWGLCGYDLWDEDGDVWTEPTRIVEAILKEDG